MAAVGETRNGPRVVWGEAEIERLTSSIEPPALAVQVRLYLEWLTAGIEARDGIIDRLRSVAPKKRLRMKVSEWARWKDAQPRKLREQTKVLRLQAADTRKKAAAARRRRVRELWSELRNKSKIAAALGCSRNTVAADVAAPRVMARTGSAR